MKINFKSKKDANLFNSTDNMNAKWGINVARKIRQRLMELKAADNLSVINHLPPQRLHILTNNRQNQYAVDINGSLRLVFIPANEPLPLLKDGGINKSKVDQIIILEVVNYHGK